MDNYISVDPLSAKPIDCWKKYQRQGRVSEPAKTLKLDTPVFDNKVRFVCISDTHEKLDEFLPVIPDGDVLIHAGDFTNYGDLGEVIKFNAEIGKLPHKYKLVIPGNHELGFEDGEEMNEKQLAGLNMLGINKAYELLSNCTYLCDRAIEVYGIKVYGAPWHSMPGYSFYRPRGQKILHKWNQIPVKTDVLITHTPPLGHGDFNSWNKMDGILAGDVELLNTVEQRVVPKYHVFGHVHQVVFIIPRCLLVVYIYGLFIQMHGATTNGITTFINAALCDHKLRSAYDPIIFDLPLPRGVTK
ncbi:hypothetical protein Y032_0085g1881 [Ancylostoma ceylanicum]|uniref:Calcineurin-like phosphoesterase domain-containing protein n=1 Tax=Ancylostoma ceylanicum TaxID=53326 RepID=A0A016TQA8_9BILA|nr:hypothetical protein Y032_0085g1881 [Ancylostoma ceylanicum]